MNDKRPNARDAAILSGLRKGEFQRSDALRLRRIFRVDDELLLSMQQEATTIVDEEHPVVWDDDENPSRYDRPFGTALQFSLFNRSGEFNDLRDTHDQDASGKSFRHADRFPALARFIDAWPDKWNFRLNVMMQSSGVRPHKEFVVMRSGPGDERWLRARFHLPLQSNFHAEVLLDGDWHHLDVGDVYLFNNGCIHTAVNHGPSARLHLVWDTRLTERAMAAIFGSDDLFEDVRRVDRSEAHPQPRRHEPVRDYEVAPFYLGRYRRLRLDALRVPPWRFQNLSTRFDYVRRRAEPLGYAHPT